MCELLWSDPQPQPGRSPSKRGVGVGFGALRSLHVGPRATWQAWQVDMQARVSLSFSLPSTQC